MDEKKKLGELEQVASRYGVEELDNLELKSSGLDEYHTSELVQIFLCEVKLSTFSRNDEAVFQPFQTLHIGSYELFSLSSADDEDGCSHHYIYIGRK